MIFSRLFILAFFAAVVNAHQSETSSGSIETHQVSDGIAKRSHRSHKLSRRQMVGGGGMGYGNAPMGDPNGGYGPSAGSQGYGNQGYGTQGYGSGGGMAGGMGSGNYDMNGNQINSMNNANSMNAQYDDMNGDPINGMNNANSMNYGDGSVGSGSLGGSGGYGQGGGGYGAPMAGGAGYGGSYGGGDNYGQGGGYGNGGGGTMSM